MNIGRSIAVVVEGHGEVQALPVLLRRLLPDGAVQVLKPHRVPKTKMVKELGRAVRFQSDRVGSDGAVVVLVDADDDEPNELAARLSAGISDDLQRRTRVVVAVKEYEAWFLAGLDSLRSHRSVRDDAVLETDPEGPRDAKGRLATQMLEPYQETIHQVAFSSILDLSTAAARSPSLRTLRDALYDLLGDLPDKR